MDPVLAKRSKADLKETYRYVIDILDAKADLEEWTEDELRLLVEVHKNAERRGNRLYDIIVGEDVFTTVPGNC